MKKTFIALAVAASAAVSGSAMAWTANGTGGSIDLGGTLAPPAQVTPWEIQVGAAVTGLDAEIQQGQTQVSIPATNAIPVLGIRTQSNQAFPGQTGISPQIDYQGAIDVSKFSQGVTTLTLEVKDAQDQKIGTLEAPMVGVGVMSWRLDDGSNGGVSPMYAPPQLFNSGFTGGLPLVPEQALGNSDAVAASLFADIAQNFDTQGYTYSEVPDFVAFSSRTPNHYSGYYASGIQANENLNITLDTPAAGDAQIPWKAALPVTISYQ